MRKTYNGKGDGSFAYLCRDHYKKLLIVCNIRRDLRQAVPAIKINEYILKEFVESLELHFLQEEERLFSALDQEDPLRLQAEKQHEQIRAVVIKLCSRTKQDRYIAEEFANLMEDNIRFEERTLFPYLESLMYKN